MEVLKTKEILRCPDFGHDSACKNALTETDPAAMVQVVASLALQKCCYRISATTEGKARTGKSPF